MVFIHMHIPMQASSMIITPMYINVYTLSSFQVKLKVASPRCAACPIGGMIAASLGYGLVRSTLISAPHL